MNRMRFSVGALIVWLFLFYNVERLSGPIDISRIAYAFVPLVAIITIAVLHKVPLWIHLLAPIPVFLGLKAIWRFEILGDYLALTISELSFITVTTILARWVGSGTEEFERTIARLTVGGADMVSSFSVGQTEMYRELKRARNHQRPLALISVGVEESSVQVAIDRMVAQAQRAMIKQYVLSDIARTLCEGLEDYNIIARTNHHFLILLPEVSVEETKAITIQLRQAVLKQNGVNLQIGAASFPNDAATFESLVKKATKEMKDKQVQIQQAQALTQEPHTVSTCEGGN